MIREKRYRYRTDCTRSTAKKIGDMTDRAREVTLATIRRHCAGLRDWEREMGYAVEPGEEGLRLKDDWAVSYYKSVYNGHPCLYICHSCIEHIWVLED